MSNGKGYVGLGPVQVAGLVKQLEGAVGELEHFARRVQNALERVAHTVPIADGQREVQYLRSIARRLGEMAADADRRRRGVEDAQRFDSHAERAEPLLGGVGAAVEEQLKEAQHWVPGHWKAGEWIPRLYMRSERNVAVIAPGPEFRARSIWELDVPGRFGPRTWVEGHTVPHAGARTAGTALGRTMNALDVGLEAWDDWSRYKELPTGERATHAAWAGGDRWSLRWVARLVTPPGTP